MGSQYKIIRNEDNLFDVHQIIEALNNEAMNKRNVSLVQEVSYLVKDSQDQVVGVIVGYIFYGSLIIDILWVEKDHRNRGLGKKLVNKLEAFAISQNAKFSIVNTMDWWEANIFYESLYYELEYVREGYEDQSKMYSLIKHFKTPK